MWQENILQTEDGQLLWAAAGDGSLLLFLHGGPGDEYRYLRPLAEPFVPDYHCVLFDQRGSGGSVLHTEDQATLHPDRFVGDIEALRTRLSAEKICLIGHSWGATLALLYGVAHPERVAGAVLIGIGPLGRGMAEVARANRLKVLSPAERAHYAHLSEERGRALEARDEERIRALNRERIRLAARALLYDHSRLDDFVEEWLSGEPHRNWRVNQLVGSQIDFDALWQRLPRLGAPILVLYGRQDFEPITQAHQLQESLPEVMLAFINEAGHVPWLEQPEAVYRAIQAFLQATDPPLQ